MIGAIHSLSDLMREWVDGMDGRRWLATSGEAIVMAQARSGGGSRTRPVAASAAVESVRARLAGEHFKWATGGGSGQRAPADAIRAYADGMAAYARRASAVHTHANARPESTQ